MWSPWNGMNSIKESITSEFSLYTFLCLNTLSLCLTNTLFPCLNTLFICLYTLFLCMNTLFLCLNTFFLLCSLFEYNQMGWIESKSQQQMSFLCFVWSILLIWAVCLFFVFDFVYFSRFIVLFVCLFSFCLFFFVNVIN